MPFGPDYFVDPYPIFADLRAHEPAHWSDDLRRWVLTRYDDATAVLRDLGGFSSAVVPQIPPADRRPELSDFVAWSRRWLFFLDQPVHAAQRSPVARALSPKAVTPLAADIEADARRLLAGRGEFDLIAEYAHPLAAGVIARLLCAPGGGTDAFLARCRAIEEAGIDARDRAARARGLDAIAGSTAHVAATVDGDPLPPFPAALRAGGADDDAVRAHSLVLLFAGVETTQNLIANAVHALLSHPDQLEILRRDPALIPSAVEEAARFALPVVGVLRRATRDIRLHGQHLHAGDEIVVMVGAANRDPGRFHDSDRFDVRRSPNPHLTFGLGPHYCPGAGLARLTAHVALSVLLERCPQLTFAETDLAWRDHDPIIRGLKRLPVSR